MACVVVERLVTFSPGLSVVLSFPESAPLTTFHPVIEYPARVKPPDATLFSSPESGSMKSLWSAIVPSPPLGS